MAPPRKTATASSRSSGATIRNRLSVPVNLRFYGDQNDNPYRVQLSPRGQQGDTAHVPGTLVEDTTFIEGEGVLFEVITKAEAKKQTYAKKGQPRDTAEVYRPEDTTVSTSEDWDGKGRVPDRKMGPTYVETPGSAVFQPDEQPDGALPPGAKLDRKNVRVDK